MIEQLLNEKLDWYNIEIIIIYHKYSRLAVALPLLIHHVISLLLKNLLGRYAVLLVFAVLFFLDLISVQVALVHVLVELAHREAVIALTG